MKKVGILYDNISRNTGDLAIGLSVKKMLLDIGLTQDQFEEMVPGISDPSDYKQIIIGGGYLLRNKGDFFYDKFRLNGNYILNSMGILGFPDDLHYLNDYSYISVRSKGDKGKLLYLKKDVNVIPDTTLLLEDLNIDIKIRKPSIGINVVDLLDIAIIDKLIEKYSKDYFIYLLPITHYNYDYNYLAKIYERHKNNKRIKLLPVLSPLEIFTIIGKFSYFVTFSLHGAYFAYKHNVPFILYEQEKMKFFMEDRNLQQYLFDPSNLEYKLNKILKKNIDYSELLIKDMSNLNRHTEEIKELVKPNTYKVKSISGGDAMEVINNENIKIKKAKEKDLIYEYANLYNKIIELESMKKDFNVAIERDNNLTQENQQLKNTLTSITSAKSFKVWQVYCKIRDKLKRKSD